ncbi:MAG TPA: hypothetical protein VL326_19780 [Kofleriaceae bacterium]|nr:hypothetical protein [Kofleriaceae bacterium]
MVPAIAMADDPVDPYAPQPTQTAPATSTTTVVAPAPAPQQQPVVVVNPEPQPARTTVVTREPTEGEVVYDQWNAPVFATGALVFAGSYGASAVVAGSSDHVGADRLYVPLVGPWLALNDWGDCPIEQPRCDNNTTDKVLLVADGVFQAAGVVTMLSGVLSPSHHTVYAQRTAQNTKTRLTPTHNGFAVVGRF